MIEPDHEIANAQIWFVKDKLHYKEVEAGRQLPDMAHYYQKSSLAATAELEVSSYLCIICNIYNFSPNIQNLTRTVRRIRSDFRNSQKSDPTGPAFRVPRAKDAVFGTFHSDLPNYSVFDRAFFVFARAGPMDRFD